MRKLFLVSLVIILVFAFLLGSCGEPEKTTQPATTQPTTTQPTSSEPSKSGGTLKIYYNGEPSNVGKPTLDDNWGTIMQLCAVECLTRADTSGTLHAWLAESWEGDADAGTLTVYLREGVKFHDGSDLDAEAVKWNWDQFTAEERIETRNVESIDIVDKYTVRANLKQWDNSIYLKLLFIAGKIVSPSAYQANGEDAPNIAVGSGPFTFDYWTPNVGARFVKWDGYRLADEGKPYLDVVEFKFIADSLTAKTAFMAGEVDVMHNIDGNTAAELDANPDYIVMNDASGIESFFLHMFFDYGTEDNPTIWTDINLRKAVAYAVDSQTLVDTVKSGYAVVTNQWGAPTNWAHSPNVVGYPYDPDKAREYLALAGYEDGLDTTLYYWTFEQDLLVAIQQMLAEVGINAEIEAQEPPASYQYVIGGGWNGLLISPKRPDGNIPYRMQLYLGTGAIEGVGLYHSPALDAMFEDALAAKDFEAQQAKAWGLQEYLYDDICHAVPLFVQSNLAAKYPYVHDDGFGTTGQAFWSPESAYMDK